MRSAKNKMSSKFADGSGVNGAGMKFHIRTYGCQMNERDSEALAGMLLRQGHTRVKSEEEAELLLFNTCSVREQAERKAIGKIGFMKKLKKRRPELIIGVMGCMAQNKKEELLREIPHLDLVLGTGQLHKLPELVEEIRRTRMRRSETEQEDEVLTEMGTHALPEAPFRASMAITRGCNRFCSYCIVPYVRGREISREQEDCLAEARALAAAGVREILLLGQNVAAFGLGGDVRPPAADHSPFAALLDAVASIPGIERVRFTSPYPSYFNDQLIRTIAANKRICRNIHLPLQSGSDAVLRAMNRQYTAGEYLELTRKIRREIPEITFSTDVIVGFPGETEADFTATRALMEEVAFDQAFIFKYSPRPGTKAAELEDSVPQEVKEERNALLLSDMEQRLARSLNALKGTEVEILVEGVSARNAERWSGRTTGNRVVNFLPTEDLHPGAIRHVRITRAGAVSLFGELLPQDE